MNKPTANSDALPPGPPEFQRGLSWMDLEGLFCFVFPVGGKTLVEGCLIHFLLFFHIII